MSVTKIIFKQGPNTPAGTQQSNPFNTVGEPLWDSVHKKFYITNGGLHPTLIGPITYTQVQANWNETYTNSPAFIQNKPNIEDRNDNIQVNISSPTMLDDGAFANHAFISYDVNTTQYVADIDETGVNAPFFDLGSIAEIIDSGYSTSKKTTLFVKNAHFGGEPVSSYENSKLPLFWYFDKNNGKFGIHSQDFKMNFYVNGALVLSGSDPSLAQPCDYSMYYDTAQLVKVYQCFAGDTLKFEIYLKDKEHLEWDINLTWPCINSGISVIPNYTALTGTQIATINNIPIYCPVSSQGGSMMISATDGVINNGNTYTVKASLDSYTSVTGNLTSVALKANGANPRTLVVKENSLFDDDSGSDAALIDDSDISNGILSWTVNPARRSYRSYNVSASPANNILTVSGFVPTGAECTDHYLFLKNSTQNAIQIVFNIASDGSASGAVRAVPSPMYVKAGTAIEISLIYKYESSNFKTAVMTASEALTILQ